MTLIWSVDPLRDDHLFNHQVGPYLADYFRDRPLVFQRLYERMWQENSVWVPSLSLSAIPPGSVRTTERRPKVG